MKLTTRTRLDDCPADIYARLSDPARLARLNDSMQVILAGPDAWTVKAQMNGADVEADLVCTVREAPDRLMYQATAQGLVITLEFVLSADGDGTDLAVVLDFAGASMKGKMLMQGLKLMTPKMQTGLEKMVYKLARPT